jgi:hypothetical protein
MIPDRTDLYSMCPVCDVYVTSAGEVVGECKAVDGCALAGPVSMIQSRVYAFRATGGSVVVVDWDCKPLVLGHQWRPHGRTGHITTVVDGRTVQLHRLVMGATDRSLLVDHRHGDKRDNRRSQLRDATHAQNRRNTKKYDGSTSRYLGVYRDLRRDKWAASIQFKDPALGRRVNRHLGYYSDEWQAAEAFNSAASEAYGEFAQLNVRLPEDTDGGGQGGIEDDARDIGESPRRLGVEEDGTEVLPTSRPD